LAKIVLLLLGMVTAALSGCHAFQNLETAQIRDTRYFYRRFDIAKSIKEINSSLYAYSTRCQQLATLLVDPANEREAQMLFTVPGWTKGSVIVVIDFHEDAAGNSTTADAYSYYTTWHRHIDEVIAAINEPGKCQ
jgi:hypothetical protein